MNTDLTLLVIAKEPVPGQVKTRLCPPCTPHEAADFAAAALADTLDAVRATPAARRIVVLHGRSEMVIPADFKVRSQVAGDLGTRLAAAFADVEGPALIVGMDTPQITPELLTATAARLDDHDAVLGPATDGGFWTIGFRSPCPDAFVDVPMSCPETGARQLHRLSELGLSTAIVETLSDVDVADDLEPVAAAAPWTRFARLVEARRGNGTVSRSFIADGV